MRPSKGKQIQPAVEAQEVILLGCLRLVARARSRVWKLLFEAMLIGIDVNKPYSVLVLMHSDHLTSEGRIEECKEFGDTIPCAYSVPSARNSISF